MSIEKQVTHLAVRFYRVDGVEMVLVPLLSESAAFTLSAGDGYYLVSLVGEPGTAYPLNLRSPGSLDEAYLEKKFHLDRLHLWFWIFWRSRWSLRRFRLDNILHYEYILLDRQRRRIRHWCH